MSYSARVVDITNQTFGRLKAIKLAYVKRQAYWECKCLCGNPKIMKGIDLRSGNSQSCGCLQLERVKHTNTMHGLSLTRFHRTWANMKTRCTNRNDPTYQRYGKRGITICERWLQFENFKKDMYQSYLQHSKQYGERLTTIERKDNNQGYSPQNCIWATQTEQSNNRTTNHPLTFKGKTQNIGQWAKELKIKRTTIHQRIRYGWSIERTLS